MEKTADGWWAVKVHLTPGHHQYWFLVDGLPILDPHASGVVHNEHNERVSLVVVG